MNAVARLIGFAAVLAVIFAGAYALGDVSGAGPDNNGSPGATVQQPTGQGHDQPDHAGQPQEDHR